jgi:hypothetical protein
VGCGSCSGCGDGFGPGNRVVIHRLTREAYSTVYKENKTCITIYPFSTRRNTGSLTGNAQCGEMRQNLWGSENPTSSLPQLFGLFSVFASLLCISSSCRIDGSCHAYLPQLVPVRSLRGRSGLVQRRPATGAGRRNTSATSCILVRIVRVRQSVP